jgi:uncharacterized protein (TIGR03437 family)
MRTILTVICLSFGTISQISAADLAKAYTFRTITSPLGAGSASGLDARENIIRSWGVVADSKRNVYYADFINHRVIKIAPDGAYSTYAGTGNDDFYGDGGPAVHAALSRPTGLAIDARDNLYIADTGNWRIRKVNASGFISTVAGGGVPGGDASDGNGGPATSAVLSYPTGVALDAQGNLYTTEPYNFRVRKIDAGSGIINAYAGSGATGDSGESGAATSAQIGYVYGIATDPAGNLYLADLDNGKVRKVSPDGSISTLFSLYNMKLPPGYLGYLAPRAVTFAPDGSLYIVNNPGWLYGSHVVFKCQMDATCTTAVGSLPVGSKYAHPGYAGDGGSATEAKIADPQGIFVDAKGNLYLSEVRRVRKVSPEGTISTIAGSTSPVLFGDGGPVASAKILGPGGTTFDEAGNMFVADSEGHRIWKVSPEGRATIIAGTGTPGFSGDNGPATLAEIAGPTDVAVDHAGNVYIAEPDSLRIRKVDPSGTISTFAGRDFLSCNYYSNNGIGAVNACLFNPQYVAAAPDGTVYIGGDYLPYVVATTGLLNVINGIDAMDDVDVDSDGTLYAVGGINYNQVLRLKSLRGTAEVVAGTGTGGNKGDGGPAISAQISPTAITLDHTGNLIIADKHNWVIRAVSADGNIRTLAGGGFDMGPSSDGGDALNAFIYPVAVSASPDGRIHVSDQTYVPTVTSVKALEAANIFRTSITNTASYENGIVAPGELVTIFGVDIGPADLTIAKPTETGFPKELAQTRILFDGVAAPIYYVQASKVTVIAPYGLAGKTSTSVQIEYQEKLTNKVTIPVLATVPGMFTTNASGSGQAAIQHWPDYSTNGAANPIKPGGVIMVYLTAGGDSGTDGAICTTVQSHPLPVTLTIGGKQAHVLYAGSAPGMVYGMLQINAVVPLDAPVGSAIPISATVGDESSQQRTTIAIAAQ